MRTLLTTLMLALLLPASSAFLQAQESASQYIEWTGDNEEANAFVNHAIWFMINWENDKAIAMFQSALHEDPTLFAPHVVLANMASGEMREAHAAKARELVEGHNEVSKMFVSLLDTDDQKAAANIWAEMHELAPDGDIVTFFYGMTHPDKSKEVFEGLVSKIEGEEGNPAFVVNSLGYIAMQGGDMETAKKHFARYIELYPEGYNPYDSMGEYYLEAGDDENALKHYQKALDIFPASANARSKVEEITARMESEGPLVLISTEHVIPEHMGEYWQWGMEYKAAADEDNFQTFWVHADQTTEISYAVMVGNTLADVAAYKKKWGAWVSQPELSEMYEKYKHSVEYRSEQLWRFSMPLTYIPENYQEPEKMEYVRTLKAYLKYGHEDEVRALMAEMKALAEEHDVTHPYQVYWNVYGEEGPCMGVRMLYENEADYAESRMELREKIGEEKMREMNQKLTAHFRQLSESENFPIADLSHFQETAD